MKTRVCFLSLLFVFLSSWTFQTQRAREGLSKKSQEYENINIKLIPQYLI